VWPISPVAETKLQDPVAPSLRPRCPPLLILIRLMDAMNSKIQKLLIPRRKSNIGPGVTAGNGTISTITPPLNSSQTSLPPPNTMNPPQNILGRPPSYSYPNTGRPQSPMPPGATHLTQHPPPIDTTNRYPGSNPTMGQPQPPGYGGQGYAQPSAPMPQPLTQFGGMRPMAEAPDSRQNKAQLIVGIDFVWH
jgi:hypothetical protein